MQRVRVVIVWFGNWFVHILFNILSTCFVDKMGRCLKHIVFFVFIKSLNEISKVQNDKSCKVKIIRGLAV